MRQYYKLPLVLTPEPEGAYTVTSPALPGLVTAGETIEEALANVPDALLAVIELYEDVGRPFPNNLLQDLSDGPIWLELLVPVA